MCRNLAVAQLAHFLNLSRLSKPFLLACHNLTKTCIKFDIAWNWWTCELSGCWTRLDNHVQPGTINLSKYWCMLDTSVLTLLHVSPHPNTPSPASVTHSTQLPHPNIHPLHLLSTFTHPCVLACDIHAFQCLLLPCQCSTLLHLPHIPPVSIWPNTCHALRHILCLHPHMYQLSSPCHSLNIMGWNSLCSTDASHKLSLPTKSNCKFLFQFHSPHYASLLTITC